MFYLADYLWIAWLVLILVFVIVELLTLDFTFLMIAAGSVGGLASSLAGAPWWLQILVSAALSMLLLFTIRPALLKKLTKGADLRPTNVAGLIGMVGAAVTTLGDGGGQVKLANGETWTSRLDRSTPQHYSPGETFASGTSVVVTAIEGSTAVVAPSERTAEK